MYLKGVEGGARVITDRRTNTLGVFLQSAGAGGYDIRFRFCHFQQAL